MSKPKYLSEAVRKYMAKRRAEWRARPKLTYPRAGTFANTKDYVEAFAKANQPGYYSAKFLDIENFFQPLSTNPIY